MPDKLLAAHTLEVEANSTSKIEGVELLPSSIRASVARRLGIASPELGPAPRDVEGLVEMLDDAVRNHSDPLTTERLFAWQAALFPSGFSQLHRIRVGAWRTEPVVVQSGAIGRETVHFEAPGAERLEREMAAFLGWWNRSVPEESAIRAGIAHLWFETIHPFDDGNGRIGRALVDMALASRDKGSVRYYSVSSQILRERADYCEALESTQRGPLDITEWIEWFLGCVHRAVQHACTEVGVVLHRIRLRESLHEFELEPRMLKVLHKLIEHEPEGFEGGLTNAKYRAMTGVSKPTASRHLASLVARGLLVEGATGGRSTRYALAPPLVGPADRYELPRS